MSRAKPLPRSGEVSKAVMVGVTVSLQVMCGRCRAERDRDRADFIVIRRDDEWWEGGSTAGPVTRYAETRHHSCMRALNRRFRPVADSRDALIASAPLSLS